MTRFHRPNLDNLVFHQFARGALCPPPSNTEFHVNHWRPALRMADLEDENDRLHFHALRHFFASWQLSTGAPLTDVAAMMGHSKAGTTLQTYAHALANGGRRRAFIDDATARLIGMPEAVSDDTFPAIAFDCVQRTNPLVLNS